jgi:sugar phosphate isomerase/epimerase
MRIRPFFSSSARVWEAIEWVYGIEESGYLGWEIVADGRYSFDNPEIVSRIDEIVQTTSLGITVHAPYADLNLAALNDPIRRESIRQVCSCISVASRWTDRVTVHPGYLSPVGKMMPDMAWKHQKSALEEIGTTAEEHSVLACLENMIGIKEFLCRMPEELVGMVDGIEGIGITIDIGHANTVGKVREFLPCLRQASHLHVHDNHGMSDEHLALGAGTIDWDLVGGRVAQDYAGVLVVEGRSLEEGRISLAVVNRWLA